MWMYLLKEMSILVVDGCHNVCISSDDRTEKDIEKTFSQKGMPQTFKGMPVGCVDYGFVEVSCRQESLDGTHGGVAVDVDNVCLTDSMSQSSRTVIIVEKARVYVRNVGNRKGLQLRILGKEIEERLAIVVGTTGFVLADI